MARIHMIRGLVLVAVGFLSLKAYINYNRSFGIDDHYLPTTPFHQRLNIALTKGLATQQAEQQADAEAYASAGPQGRLDAQKANIADYQKVMERELSQGKTLLRIRLYGADSMDLQDYAYKNINYAARDLYWHTYINELQKLMPEVIFDPNPHMTDAGNPAAYARLRPPSSS